MEQRPPEDAIPIGDGHSITYAHYDGEICGVNEWHRKKDGTWCVGWVPFHGRKWLSGFPGSEGWNVVSEQPLTLTPSIKCRSCGNHGFITEGQWRAA